MDPDVCALSPVGPPSPTPPDAIAAYEQALQAVENHYDALEDAATVLAELVTQHPPLAGTRLNATDEVTLGSQVEWLTSELTEVGSRLFAIAELPVEEAAP